MNKQSEDADYEYSNSSTVETNLIYLIVDQKPLDLNKWNRQTKYSFTIQNLRQY